MRAMWTLSVAMMRGFARDGMSVFLVILFPLMFLFLFGGIFSDQGQSRSSLVAIGDVSLIDEMPASARAQFDEAFEVERSGDRAAAVAKVRGRVRADRRTPGFRRRGRCAGDTAVPLGGRLKRRVILVPGDHRGPARPLIWVRSQGARTRRRRG
ncbi:MAG: hypothetical protein ACRDOJ_13135 [Nocardioidaceae bacterium]